LPSTRFGYADTHTDTGMSSAHTYTHRHTQVYAHLALAF